MEKIIRTGIVLVILLSGLALLPYIDLPAEALNWQLYAGVYEATLDVNHTTGSPGSYFLFTGANFPANSIAAISVNGNEVGTVETDGSGDLSFIISTAHSDPGSYTVTATVDVNASAAANFTLSNNDPHRPLEGTGPIFSLLEVQYLPVVRKP
ncbi:MAG: hypothetical protein WAM60_12885 [Candidatus Promineifilaceae bacterium]